MKHLIALALIIGAMINACLAEKTQPDEFDYPQWVRVMNDDGAFKQRRAIMIGHPSIVIRKILKLDFVPEEVTEVAVEYAITTFPYDYKIKMKIRDPAYPWANLLVKVNGMVIMDRPAGKYILPGTHCLKFSPTLLQRGKNTIDMSWKPIPANSRDQQTYGYIYLGAARDSHNVKKKDGVIRFLLKIAECSPVE